MVIDYNSDKEEEAPAENVSTHPLLTAVANGPAATNKSKTTKMSSDSPSASKPRHVILKHYV